MTGPGPAPTSPAASPGAPPTLRVRDLRFRYPSASAASPWTVDVTALDLARGDQLLLTGGSGTGKSTLLHLIAGLEDPAHGTVEVAGARMHELGGARRDAARGRLIGMIFQTFHLLPGFSALENVMMALMFSTQPPRDHRSIARQTLTHLGIERQDADVQELSVGQQQRVAVARAVVCKPALVLADEPTASLDPENAATAITLIQQACRDAGAALLCVSHDPAMADRFTRRVRLQDLRSDRGAGPGGANPPVKSAQAGAWA